jgi:site-specific DNA-methyltransferase (cytosine-N4-specific)
VSLYYQDETITLHHGDSLAVARTLESESVDCIVTSPPYYGLRDYGNDGQYGLEESPAAYVETMRALFSELRRVLADDGTLYVAAPETHRDCLTKI